MSGSHIADTGFLLALGTSSKERYHSVQTYAKRNDITFSIPERVYEELTGAVSSNRFDADSIPVNVAIDEGWVRVADPLDYTMPLVSKTMDGIQCYISNADDRPADEIERADPALGALAAQLLSTGTTTHAYIYTTDRAAGEGAIAVLGSAGYGDSVTIVDGFAFIDDLLGTD